MTQDQPLTSEDKNVVVPNISCDNGGCSPSLASIWKSPLTFGFGVRCEKSNCSSDFSTDDSFRPLSSTAYPFISVRENLNESLVVYKLNIAATQAPTPYFNKVTYILIPNL